MPFLRYLVAGFRTITHNIQGGLHIYVTTRFSSIHARHYSLCTSVKSLFTSDHSSISGKLNSMLCNDATGIISRMWRRPSE